MLHPLRLLPVQLILLALFRHLLPVHRHLHRHRPLLLPMHHRILLQRWEIMECFPSATCLRRWPYAVLIIKRDFLLSAPDVRNPSLGTRLPFKSLIANSLSCTQARGRPLTVKAGGDISDHSSLKATSRPFGLSSTFDSLISSSSSSTSSGNNALSAASLASQKKACKEELAKDLVKWQNINTSFEEFPYFLEYVWQLLLCSRAAYHLMIFAVPTQRIYLSIQPSSR